MLCSALCVSVCDVWRFAWWRLLVPGTLCLRVCVCVTPVISSICAWDTRGDTLCSTRHVCAKAQCTVHLFHTCVDSMRLLCCIQCNCSLACYGLVASARCAIRLRIGRLCKAPSLTASFQDHVGAGSLTAAHAAPVTQESPMVNVT